MGIFKPSKYQKAVYTFIKKCRGNAVIDAVAGSGKTTTIVNALKLIPKDKNVLFLAFNKSIVDELKIKIGNLENVEVRTLHSLGASSILRTLHSSIDNTKYSRKFNDDLKEGYISPSSDLSKEKLGEWKTNIKQLVNIGRVNLVNNINDLNDLAYKYNLFIVDNECEVSMSLIKWGTKNYEYIDFTDMIYLPNVLDVRVNKYDYVFIDECQDLNASQRNLFLKCIKKNGRFIAVGDPRQAIYGFCGADVESFNILKNLPHTAKLPLSICYRCDKSIIELAKTIVPTIEANPSAPDGIINREDNIKNIKDGDMVLCRVSAPLVGLCMKFISNGTKAYVKGRDIGKNLINMIEHTRRKNILEVLEKLRGEEGKIIGKVIAKTHCSEAEAKENDFYKIYEDKVDAIEVLSGGLQKSSEVIDRIESVFSDEKKSGICLSTVHKAKGLESDRVFIIREDKFLLKCCMKVDWMRQQEYNLQYVAYTRAKHYLGFVKDF
jgi:superfamily I DNA/RNA helicase